MIEAYRKSHHGDSPSPALVKQILTSSATDLGTPASEQGAGIINTYNAVLLAESINNGTSWSENSHHAVPALLLSPNQLNIVGAPGTTKTWPVTVTNPSSVWQAVSVHGRTFGPEEYVQSGSVTLEDATSPQFVDFQGLQNNYAVINFKVRPGADRLNASIAYPANPANGNNARVRLILIDPQGRLAAHSLPQGVGNFGNVDVRQPIPGTWAGVIFGIVSTSNGTNGAVPWQVSTQRFSSFGWVSASSFFLAPGQSRTIQVSATTPSAPGDAAGSIVLSSSAGGFDNYVGFESNSIPVTLRSLVDIDYGGGAFSGVLTGGNGRPPGEGQVDYFEFNVPPGHRSITANLSLTNDAGNPVGAYLVNPDGVAVGFGDNSSGGSSARALTANALNPVTGTWTLIVNFAEPIVGDELSQPFSGNIKLDATKASATGLPNSSAVKLPTGVPVTVPVTITNTGAAAEAFFIDARLDTVAPMVLASLQPPPSSSGYPLPLGSVTAAYPLWLMPTETSGVQAAATATLPIVFDYAPYPGDPDLFGAPTGPTTAAGSYAPAGGTVSQGLWYSFPTEIGPYAGPAPAGFVNMSLTANTKAFDPAVSSPTGDLWTAALNPSLLGSFSPVLINPGQSVVVPVTITPAGTSGSVVSGTLYIDDAFNGLPVNGTLTGNEVAALRYSYTIQ